MKYVHIACVFAVLSFATLVHATAPVGQYAGFIDTDTVIVDLKTGLTWTRSATPNVSFLAAQTTCASAGTRVPTLKELLTLVDETPHPEFVNVEVIMKNIDEAAFGPETPVDAPYWSITPAAKTGATTTMAFAVDFGTGLVQTKNAALSGGDAIYVRCVK